MGEMSVNEAGRLGGYTTRQRYGSEFFRRIGKEGGKRTTELYRDVMKQWGRKGGRPRRPALDDHMQKQDR